MVAFDPRLQADYPEASKFFGPIEGAVDDWRRRFGEYEGWAHDEMSPAYDAGGTTAEMLIASQLVCISSRLGSLTSGVISLANEVNGAALPAVARALFETACVPFYLSERVMPLVRKSRAEKAQRELYRLGLGTAADAGIGHIKPVTVGSLMKAGKSWLETYAAEFSSETGISGELPGAGEEGGPGVFTMIHGPLTDATHPNYGSISQPMEIDTRSRTVQFFAEPPLDGDKFDYTLASVWWSLLTAGEAADAVVEQARGRTTLLPDAEPVWQPGDTHGPAGGPSQED